MGAFCAMLRPPFFGSLTTGALSGLPMIRITYDTSTIILGCLIAMVALWRAKSTRGGSPAGWGLAPLAIVGALATIGVLLVNAGKFMGVTAGWFYAVSVVAIDIGFAVLTVGWFRILAQQPRDKVAALVMGAFVASHVFGLLDFLPREWESFLGVLYPLLALVMLCLLQGEPAVSPDRRAEPLFQDPHLRKVQVCAMVLIFAELFCGAFLRSVWAHGGMSYNPNPLAIYAYIASTAVGVLFLFIALRAKMTAECTLVIGSIGLAGFLVITFLFVTVSHRTFAPFSTGLYSALLAYSIALISLWGTDNQHEPSLSASFFLVLYGIASGATSSIIPAILSQFHLEQGEHLFPVGLAAALVISVGMCAMLFIMVIVHRKSFLGMVEQYENQEVPVETRELSSDERHEQVMAMIAERYALTDRERETASLMARGYTAKRVAEELTVAVSTVKGYSKSIYLKMGIHRKDELIEIVKETKARV